MVSSRLFFSTIWLLIIVINTLAQPQPVADYQLNHFCSNDKGNYTTTDTYGTSISHLLSSLLSTKGNDSGFYRGSYGGISSSEAIYAIGLCTGDLENKSDCLQCLNTSRSALMELCPNQKEAIVWYVNCMLRYSNRSIYGVMETQPAFDMWSTDSVPASEFDILLSNLTGLLEILRIEAAAGGSLKFAKDSLYIADLSSSFLTAQVQCTPDLSELQCRTCLLGAFEKLPKCCDGKEGGRVLRPSCNFNYQLTNDTRFSAPSWPFTPDADFYPDSHGTDGIMVNFLLLFAMVVNVSIGLMFIVGGIYMRVAKTRPQPTSGRHPSLLDSMDALQFDCADIRVATDNFSEATRLGHDKYGTVYRGSLFDGKSVAVRRLPVNYVKEYMEIKKEVLLSTSKLQHANLVELLGYALEENSERLLVYELFPNATLDNIIFDKIKSRQWDWEMRYNIILSIARGLLHLHDSHFVHGDLKATNILINAQMNPKISNFGMARFFIVDQTQGNDNGIHMLNLIKTTYMDNMAPEAIDEQSPAESDVYSFGAIVVEIVSGQEISSLPENLNEKDLLSFAWKNWAEGTIRNLIDPTLWTGSGIELMEKCIRIGLLCMQRTRANRPTMSSVVQMLSSSTVPPPCNYRDGSFGIIGASDPRSEPKSFIAKMRTGLIRKMSRKSR